MKTFLKLLATVAVLAGAVLLLCRWQCRRPCAGTDYIPLEMD